MPEFQRLTREQLAELTPGKKPGPRQQVREQYQGFLREIEAGEGGQVLLTEGDNRNTVRTRLKAAAKEVGKNITFLRTRENVVRFRVEDGAGEGEEAVVDTPPAAASPEETPPPAEERPKRSRRRAAPAGEGTTA